MSKHTEPSPESRQERMPPGEDPSPKDGQQQPADAPSLGEDAHRRFEEEALPNLDAVYRFALRLTGDDSRAEDLAQETFLRAYRSWHQYTAGTRCKSWLFTICRNVHLRNSEREVRREEILTQEAAESPREISRENPVFMSVRSDDPEGTFFDSIVDDEILRAIEELPEEFRSAVVLSDREGLNYQEISGLLSVPVGTVKSRIFRGRRMLQERLHDYAVATGLLSSPRRSGVSRTRTRRSRPDGAGENT